MSTSVNPYSAPPALPEQAAFEPLHRVRLKAIAYALKTLNSLCVVGVIALTAGYLLDVGALGWFLIAIAPGALCFCALLASVGVIFGGVVGLLMGFACFCPISWPFVWLALNWRGRHLMKRQGMNVGLLGDGEFANE